MEPIGCCFECVEKKPPIGGVEVADRLREASPSQEGHTTDGPKGR
jgi:hypothetical protein